MECELSRIILSRKKNLSCLFVLTFLLLKKWHRSKINYRADEAMCGEKTGHYVPGVFMDLFINIYFTSPLPLFFLRKIRKYDKGAPCLLKMLEKLNIMCCRFNGSCNVFLTQYHSFFLCKIRMYIKGPPGLLGVNSTNVW